ncbi:MAG TPA: hypothetical protein VFT16_03395 [Candidatus Saccharimonadales bacterium]|nr:hypothetical protein [Candidatus Saccharimonadales bacterium]
MRKPINWIVGVVILFVGVLFGYTAHPESPAPEDGAAVVIGQSPKKAPTTVSASSPEGELLMAIGMMKPDFHGTTTPNARVLYTQLTSMGYYYWTTYPDGTERINHKTGDRKTVNDDAQIKVSNNGTLVSAASYGDPPRYWGVSCPASPSRPTVDSLTQLLVKTERAAKKWEGDLTCQYIRLDS